MGIFKNPFKKKSFKRLEHPKDLMIGDIVKFSFLSQPDLSNKKFEVVEINTYDFKHEVSTQFSLKGEGGNIIFLVVENEDGEESLSVSKSISRKVVKKLFKEKDFAGIFNNGTGVDIERIAELDDLEGWTAPYYVCGTAGKSGYFHKGDYRGKELPKYEDDSEGLDYYLLSSEEDEFAIEAEVYENGETEVCVTAYLENSSIEEMWPKGS